MKFYDKKGSRTFLELEPPNQLQIAKYNIIYRIEKLKYRNSYGYLQLF